MRVAKMKRKRRATILLMVVSLLALLFVIVTGFLSLARNNRGITEEVAKSDLIDSIAEDVTEMAVALIKDQLVDASGKVLAGGSALNCSYEDIPRLSVVELPGRARASLGSGGKTIPTFLPTSTPEPGRSWPNSNGRR